MANIRKSFNFRNGVQVDEDNLIVNPNGLVGIGTSIPTEILDVRGTAKVVGLITATEVFASNIRTSGVSTFSGGLRVGIVSVGQNGIVTATSGIVTYYGDGGRLLNLPTSQWLDVDIGLGFTSIYAQGFVGVGTISPIYPFQVGGTAVTRSFENVNARGVGIDSTGNIYSTGIVTARSYNGIGLGLTDLSASNIASGTLDTTRLPSNINISGILTASTSIRTSNVTIDSSGIGITGSINASGIITGTQLRVTNANITGVVTATTFIGNLTGIANTAQTLTGTPNIEVGIVTATRLVATSSTIGVSTVTSRLHVLNNAEVGNNLDITNKLYVGGSIGLNTASPTTDVHIVKNGVGGVLLTSTQESFVGVARTLTRGQQGGEIRFGNLSGSFSGQRALDLVNYDTGNVNYYIHQGIAGINTGNFNWVYGQDQTARMTLTWDGKLGIAKTNPDHQLHVVGTSTITEDLYIGDDLFVKGDSSLIGDLTVSGNFNTNNLNVLGGISANLNNVSGVSTFFDIDVTNTAELNRVAIQTSATEFPFQIGPNNNQTVFISNASAIGIGTTVIPAEVNISAQDAAVIIRAVGVGTTRPRSAVDFADAGKGYFSDSKRFLITPRVTTAERNSLDTSTINASGAIVFNTSLGVHQAYNGSAWLNIGSGGGGTISYTDRAGIATYASIAGFSTNAANVIGGIVTCSSISCTGIATVSELKVGTGVTINSGIVTATNGFLSGIGTAVKITTVGNQLVFTVPGVGTTSLTLF